MDAGQKGFTFILWRLSLMTRPPYLNMDAEGYIHETATVQITFIFIGQTHVDFGKRICTCVKTLKRISTFLNLLKNWKRVLMNRNCTFRCASFRTF